MLGIYGICRAELQFMGLEVVRLGKEDEHHLTNFISWERAFLTNVSGSQAVGKGEGISCPFKSNAGCFIYCVCGVLVPNP